MYYSCMCTHTVSTKIQIKFASIRTFSSRSKAEASFPCRLAFFGFLFFSCLYMYTQNLMFVECNIHGSLDLEGKEKLGYYRQSPLASISTFFLTHGDSLLLIDH